MGDSPADPGPGTGPLPQPEPFLVSTPEALRAIAHPLRQRILLELAILKYGRAADLARILDQPANAVSFHLRALAKAGLIIEAPEHARDRRDRVWQLAAESYALDREVPGWTAVVDPMLDWVRHTVLDPVTDETVHRQMAATQLSLTKAEVAQLTEELTALISDWHDRAAETTRSNPEDPGRTRYQVLFAVGPWNPAAA